MLIPIYDKKHQQKLKASSPYVVLPVGDIDVLRPIISEAITITTSVNKMLKQLQDQGLQAQIFKPIYDFLKFVEGYNPRAYEINTHLTIGIGFDITSHTDEELKAVFSASLDPARKWTLADLKTKDWPSDGLTDKEINNLLLNAIVGVEPYYHGILPRMVDTMQKQDVVALIDAPFLASQLIVLLSMAYNLPALFGKGAINGLKFLQEKGSDVVSLIDIVEQSNSGLDVGLQNRRLKEAALFHGNAVHSTLDVHLSWRQYMKLGAPQVETPVIWGVPTVAMSKKLFTVKALLKLFLDKIFQVNVMQKFMVRHKTTNYLLGLAVVRLFMVEMVTMY